MWPCPPGSPSGMAFLAQLIGLAGPVHRFPEKFHLLPGGTVSGSGLLTNSSGASFAIQSSADGAGSVTAGTATNAGTFTNDGTLTVTATDDQRVSADTQARFLAPPLRLCTDNAAMIAWAGIELFRLGQRDDMTLAAWPRWPLDATSPAMLGSGKKGAKA